MIKDIISKVMKMGLGATIASKDKVEEVLDSLVVSGKLSKEDAKEAIDNMMQESRKEFESAQSEFYQKLFDMINNIGLVTEDQLRPIMQRIARLETEIERLENKDKGE